MQRWIAYVLMGGGILALGGTMVFATTLMPAYEKMQRTGDGAAFGLGMMMLFFWLLPATMALLLSGLILLPRLRGLGPPMVVRRSVAILAWIGAALLSLRLFSFVGGALLRSQQFYGYQGRELVRLFLQDLALSLPLLALVAVLAGAGVMLWRARPQA